MSLIQGAWHDKDNNIYRADFFAGWQWDDYHLFLDDIRDNLDTQDNPLHMIVVYAPDSKMPAGSTRPHHGRSAKVLKLGITVSVTQNLVAKAFVRQSQRMLNRKENTDFAIRDTVEEAYQFILEQIQKQAAIE